MKFSELDISKLSLEEKYALIMNGVQDYASHEATDDKKVDFLVVLGGRPVALKSRILKTIELYKRNYTKYILFSGGHGWNRRVEVGSPKDLEMVEYCRSIIDSHLFSTDIEIQQKFFESQYPNADLSEIESIQKETEDRKIRNLTECQLMTRMMMILGDVPQNKIYHEPFSNTTIENVKYTQALFRSLLKRGEINDIQRVMLVTSSFHCRRAILTFKKYFKDLSILVCPTTLDLKEKGISLSKEDILTNEFYVKQIENELNAIINYTKNGTIEDCNITDLIDSKLAKKIEEKHKSIEVE